MRLGHDLTGLQCRTQEIKRGEKSHGNSPFPGAGFRTNGNLRGIMRENAAVQQDVSLPQAQARSGWLWNADGDCGNSES
jgi:hypothetical protein